MTKDHAVRHRSRVLDPLLHQPHLHSPHWSHRSHFFCLFLFLLTLAGCSSRQPAHPDDASIRAFLPRYFPPWSAKDMDAYAACSPPQARVLSLTESGQVASEGLTDSPPGQRLAQETAAVPMSEKP